MSTIAKRKTGASTTMRPSRKLFGSWVGAVSAFSSFAKLYLSSAPKSVRWSHSHSARRVVQLNDFNVPAWAMGEEEKVGVVVV
jgi:hypothetical protein